ncbi:MAG: formylglycine-generating enzyme family protein [Gallionella sp.]|nr:formylglycine-generating enzyme family protein [Gallionella sp.]
MLSSIAIAVVILGGILILFGLMGIRLKFFGQPLQQWLGEFARGIGLVVGICLITLGIWLYPNHESIRGMAKDEVAKAELQAAPLPQQISTKPGSVFRDCPSCPEMIVLPAGKFLMGAPEAETAHEQMEMPQHSVTLNYALAVARTEISFAEWDVCSTAGVCRKNVESNWPRGQQPAININWNDANTYIEWLSKTTGQSYRLLTESEWEYAARGNTQTAYSWGNQIGNNQANCSLCGSQSTQSKVIGPQLVGSYTPNLFGLFDMHGNVQEWVQDCWHENYQGAPQDGSAWITACSEGRRIVRGGAWDSSATALRSAARDRKTWDHLSPSIGFRVARVITLANL